MKRIWEFFSYLFNPRTSGQMKKLIEGDEVRLLTYIRPLSLASADAGP